MFEHKRRESIEYLKKSLTEQHWAEEPPPLGWLDEWRKNARPSVILEGDLEDKSLIALEHLVEANDPPKIFKKDGQIVSLVVIRNQLKIDIMGVDRFRAFLSQNFKYQKYGKLIKGMDPDEEGAFPIESTSIPLGIVKNMAARRPLPFPEIEEIIRNPIFDRNGKILLSGGYKKNINVWLDPPKLDVNLPSYPTQQQVEDAKDLILNEVLGDFPFADHHSKANAVAMGLLPFVRKMIEGPTPLHMVTAPVPGSGKGLLVRIFSRIATGREPKTMTEARNEEEWRKRITSTMLDNPAFICLDNLKGKLESPALEAVLTQTEWTDRILQQSLNVTCPNTAVWTATSNNPQLSKDMARRSCWVHFMPNTENPDERTDFKHTDILGWVDKNRDRLLSAMLTLIQAWIADGRPTWGKVIGSFEAWSHVLGGILQTIGIEGFMGNRDSLRERTTDLDQQWRRLYDIWSTSHTGKEESSDLFNLPDEANDPPKLLTTREIHSICTEEDILLEVLGYKGESSQKTRLGKALSKNLGRIYGGWRLESSEDTHKKTKLWRIVSVVDPH